jgi:hypothetical protein
LRVAAIAVSGFCFQNCSSGHEDLIAGVFGQPEPVTIQGYSGPQEDPVASADGNYLFFDTHNDANEPTHLHLAKRVDYKTFQYVGPLQGTASLGDLQIEGVDDFAHNFYFIAAGSNGSTIERGLFANEGVSGIAPVQGISTVAAPAGKLALFMDLNITADGSTIYFTDAIFSPTDGPQSAHLSIAKKNSDGTFTRDADSGELLQNINALGNIVYNAAPSADGLELAFNVADTRSIYIATRTTTSVPFDQPRLLAAAYIDQGMFSEPGSISVDGEYLYFHRVLSENASQIYVLARQATESP